MAENTTWSPRTSEESTFASRNADIFDYPPQDIQIPGGFFPHSQFKDALWITMQARELGGINTGGRGGNLTIGRAKTKFKFMSPSQVVEMHNHDWNEYASVASRLLEKIKSLQTGYEQARDVFGGTTLKGTTENIKNILTSKSIDAALETAASQAQSVNVNVPRRKVDTPLTYTNSQRRQIQFEFQLADNEGGQNVVMAVKLMQSFAAATTEGSGIKIGFPHIWKIQSIPEGLILMDAAAMTSIQPTWQYPFVNGYPTRCDLTVSFTDMSPLFQKTITTGSIISVHPTSKDTEPTYDLPTQIDPITTTRRNGRYSPRN